MNGDIIVQIEEPVINIQVSTPGASKFIDLEDTPQQYSVGKFLRSTDSGLEFAVPQGGGDMLISVYDPNQNDIVDFAEGVRVLTSFPPTTKKGDIIVVGGKVFINL